MKSRFASLIAVVAALAALVLASPSAKAQATRPAGPCDVYAAAGDPCVAAHSTTRALYAAYTGALYQVLRQSDGKTLDIGVVRPSASDPGGYADAPAQDRFCADTVCFIAKIYDQSPKHNDLTQAPRGGFSGPAMGGFNNLPIADMAPVSLMGHKVYGVFIAPGMGLRQNDVHGTAVDDQAEGQYWVINGQHFNSGCCFDYGNAEIDSRDDGNGTMETTYFGDSTGWYHGNPPGPWVMTDQENNLVGCVNPDGTKLCATLPNITWRFVTAMAKGEPHHWTSLGGDAQQGPLQVMFDGPRVDRTYDPMRKQGAILLGNGGDNSNSSQGTFYEGAMTATGTFPTDATDQQVQANVVATHYAVASLSIAPAANTTTPPGLQTFTPGESQDTTVTFTNTTAAPVSALKLSLALPPKWSAIAIDSREVMKTFGDPIAPGASVSTTFKITAGPAAFNGDLVAKAAWNSDRNDRSETAIEKLRSTRPVKINEFRTGGVPNLTDAFIELYNAGSEPVDLSGWSLTEHAAHEPVTSAITIPAGKQLEPHGFYLLSLANSGLAAPAQKGDRTLHVRDTTGMKAGDTITIGSGAEAETHTIASPGTATAPATTLWQPVPEGPVITVPAGATNVPITSNAGFIVGEKIALGYGAVYPVTNRSTERFEVRTVTAVGKPGTQAYLAAEAAPGATNIKVSSVANLSVGDTIRLDVDSVGHGVETVTIAHVGTQALRPALRAPAETGATTVNLRAVTGLSVGDTLFIGTQANRHTYTILDVSDPQHRGPTVTIQPALSEAHAAGEPILRPGTGLDLAAPLRFKHAANLPFSSRGTGITFTPATAFAHSSNEPVRPLGTGITLEKPLAYAQPIDAPVRDAAVTTAGFQGPPPNQWFGGPALSRVAGSIVLRDASGLVADSLNYGLLVDPWAAEGYHGVSGAEHSGCRVAAPDPLLSAGRSPDGADTDSNCTDFQAVFSTTLAADAATGAANLKVDSVRGYSAGQRILVGVRGSMGAVEEATVTAVGSPGATTLAAATEAGATTLELPASAGRFTQGEPIVIGEGADEEPATVASSHREQRTQGGPPSLTLTLTAPLTRTHANGAQVAGTGITLAAPLKQTHPKQSVVLGMPATPGAANRF